MNYTRRDRIVVTPVDESNDHNENNNNPRMVHVRLQSTTRASSSSSTNDKTSQLPPSLLSPETISLMSKFGAVHVQLQLVSSTDDRCASSSPPGLSVRVEFSNAALSSSSSSSSSLQPPQAQHPAEHEANDRITRDAQQHLEEAARDQLVRLVTHWVGWPHRDRTYGSRLPVPLASLTIPRLHRTMAVEDSVPSSILTARTTSSTTVVSVVLPLDGGAAAMASPAGFVTFVQQEGLWRLASAADWSRWMLGWGPSSLDDAAAAQQQQPEQQSPGASKLTRAPRHLSVQWSRQCDNDDGDDVDGDDNDDTVCVDPEHTNDTTNDASTKSSPSSCHYTIQHGLEYTVAIGDGSSSSSLSLAQLLPPTAMGPVAPSLRVDATVVQLRPNSVPMTASSQSPSHPHLLLTWGPACATSNSSRDDSPRYILHSASSPLPLDAPCFLWNDVPDEKEHEESSAVGSHYSYHHYHPRHQPYWNVQSTIRRPLGVANGGVLQILLTNRHACPVQASLQQIVPAVLDPIWRSLTVLVNDTDPLPWHGLDHRAVHIRSDEYELSLTHSLPGHTTLLVQFHYAPTFLNADDFPADANRGFDISPAHARFRVELDGSDLCHAVWSATHHGKDWRQNDFDDDDDWYGSTTTTNDFVHAYSNPHLVMAPLPDRSMPFNVISLTCTLYAFVVGSMINALVKKASRQLERKRHPHKKHGPDAPILKLVAALRSLGGTVKERLWSKATAPTRTKDDDPVLGEDSPKEGDKAENVSSGE